MFVLSQKIYLQVMQVRHIDDGAFCGLNQVSELQLSHNHLVSPPPLCPIKCCLQNLQLNNNLISNWGKNFFTGFKKLKFINLRNNNIIQLPDLYWVRRTLTLITAAENHITSLDAFQADAIFKCLARIQFSSNDIQNFNATILRRFPRLKHLYLGSNGLTYMGDFRSYYDEYIEVSFNPWHCDAAISWMGEAFDEASGRYLTCATPFCLRGMVIVDMGD